MIMKNIYDLSFQTASNKKVNLSDYKWKVLLIANTASKCGLAYQYKWLEEIYQKYKDRWLVVIWFPSNQFANQEPLDNKDIESSCLINYWVSFPISKKIDVNWDNTDEIFKLLKDKSCSIFWKKIKWNFTKFLVSKDGEKIIRFSPTTNPKKLEKHIEKML